MKTSDLTLQDKAVDALISDILIESHDKVTRLLHLTENYELAKYYLNLLIDLKFLLEKYNIIVR